MLRRAIALQASSIFKLAAVAPQAVQTLSTAAPQSGNNQQSWSAQSLWMGASLALGATAFADSQTGRAQADASMAPQQPQTDAYTLPAAAGHLPSKITLYQYEVCPFCCKVKAFLDYNKLPYTTVEVNPLTKGELRWTSYRKVPVVKLDDEVVVDSSAIISRLAAELQTDGKGSSSSSSSSNKVAKKGWFGGAASGSSSRSSGSSTGVSAEEERHWRKWVDERFVKVLTANIYRSWDESWGTFNYMTQQSHWNWAVQQSVRLAGAVLMWKVGQGMPKKYNITGDLREALYADADSFIAAVGDRQFLGGDTPNLADLAVFGVLQAIRGTDTYNDVVLHSKIGPWLSRMVLIVGDSCEVKQVPAAAAA